MDFNQFLYQLEERAKEQLKPQYLRGAVTGFFLSVLPLGTFLKIPIAIFLSQTVGGETQQTQKDYNAGVIFGIMLGQLWKK